MKLIVMVAAVSLPFVALADGHGGEGKPGGHFLESWDLDGDGTATLAELQEKRGYVFASFDANEDGFLDRDEYDVFDQARENDMQSNGDHGNGGMRRVQKGMQMQFNDADGDGKVSAEEFTEAAVEWLGLIDRNESGDITADDFGSQN